MRGLEGSRTEFKLKDYYFLPVVELDQRVQDKKDLDIYVCKDKKLRILDLDKFFSFVTMVVI